jgi:hypothetical protein
MAYVKLCGLNPLLHSADGLLTKGGCVRIVFGLSERLGITDWQAAERLLKLSKRHGNVLVKKWNSAGFHPKLLLFHGNPSHVVVGSANLTVAAQNTNAEANIVVENPSAQFIKDAQEFFDRYFTGAPLLKPADLETYKMHAEKTPSASGAARSDEDALPQPPGKPPPPIELPAGARLWKIAPGKDAKDWDEWAREIDDDGVGVVAIGWNEVGDLEQFQKYDDLRSKVADTAQKVWNREWGTKTKVGYVADQLWQFRHVRKRDRFIVYSEQRVLGVAEVIDGAQYQYRPPRLDSDLSYAHQITVKYLWHRQWPAPADARVKATLGKQGTLMLVDKPGFWQYFVSKLR